MAPDIAAVKRLVLHGAIASLVDLPGMSFDHVWLNAHLATMVPRGDDPLGVIEDGAVAAKDGRIAWIGPRRDLPCPAHDAPVTRLRRRLDPARLDRLPHAHGLRRQPRPAEFEMRLGGASYEEPSPSAGGGILSTIARHPCGE